MAAVKRISQIFQEVSDMRFKRDRIEYLQKHASTVMQMIAQGAYHPSIVWLLPKGVPPFKSPNPHGLDGALSQYVRQFYLYYEGGHKTLTQAVREKKFIYMLENIHPDDAKLLCDMKDKKMSLPFMTYALFREAFPSWLPEEPQEVYVPINARPDNKKFKKVAEKEKVV